MNRIICLLLSVILLQVGKAQNPVHWQYSTKKISATKYEIRITASIDPGWHIYSTKQTEEGIGLPTSIKLNKNPLLTTDGKIKEEGELKMHKFEDVGITNLQFENTVTFVQTVILKNKVKTTVSGKIDYMACTEEMCLPPASTSFAVKVGE